MQKTFKTWDQLLEYVTETFGIEANLVSALYLIGLHESGHGFRTTSRERKTELIKLAQYTLLSRENFYFKLLDSDHQMPAWIENPARLLPSDPVLEKLLQSLILEYFNQKKL